MICEITSTNNVTIVTLGDSLNISNAQEVYSQLHEALTYGCPILFDASCVERVDTSILQIRSTFFCDPAAGSLGLNWKNPSTVFKEAALQLDLGSILTLT